MTLSADGRLLASGNSSGTIQLWQTTTGTLIWNTTVQVDASVTALSFSPNSKFLAVGLGSSDKEVLEQKYDTIQIRRIDDGDLIEALQGYNQTIRDLAFSIDDQKLASSSWDNTIRIWTLNTT